MQFKPQIFIFVLIPVFVTVIYASSFGDEVCAQPRDPSNSNPHTTCGDPFYIPGGDGHKKAQTCCWTERDIFNPSKVYTYCQTCSTDNPNDCSDLFEPGTLSAPPDTDDSNKDTGDLRSPLFPLDESKFPQKDPVDQRKDIQNMTKKPALQIKDKNTLSINE